MSRRRKRKNSPDLPAAPKNTPAGQIVEVRHEKRRFSGPLPSPEILRGYDEILPGTAERIIHMAEREQAHAHEANMFALRETAADMKRGQMIGGVLAAAALGTAAFLGHHELPIAASTIGGATVVGLVTVFVTGRRSPSSRSEQGSRALSPMKTGRR